MATTVSRATIAKNVMDNFIDLMKCNTETITIWDPSKKEYQDHTIQRFSSTYSDSMLKSKTNYPVLIVRKPSLPENFLTYRNMQVEGTIILEIHATNSLVTTQFYDQMKEIIITNKSVLSGVGIKEVIFTEDDEDTETRNGFKDHWAESIRCVHNSECI